MSSQLSLPSESREFDFDRPSAQIKHNITTMGKKKKYNRKGVM